MRPTSRSSRTRTAPRRPRSPSPRSGSSVQTPYNLPALYEEPFRDREADVAFFVECAKSSAGPILEYGCGSGRVTIPLLQAGHDVTCVDSSAPMLAALRRRVAELHSLANPSRGQSSAPGHAELVRADMRRYRAERKFPLVLATFNVVAHLPRLDDMRAWLARVRDALTTEGELVFDVPIPNPDELEADPEERVRLRPFRHPQTGELIEHDERLEYDPRTQLLLVESDHWTRGSADRLTTRLVLRQWFPRELESLLRYERFEARLCADYTDLPLPLAQDTVIVRARPRK